MRKLALVSAAGMLTLLTSCGGGGGGDRLSEREYIRSLEDICADVNGDIADLDVPDLDDFDGLADFAADANRIVGDGLDDLEELNPPEDLEGDHDDFVASAQRTVDAFDDLQAAAEDESDDDVADALEAIQEESDERNAIAEDIGADGCVEDAGSEPGGELTAEEYVAALDDLCASVNSDIDDLEGPEDDEDYPGWADLAEQAATIMNAALEQLTALSPPAELADAHADYVSSIERTITATGDLQAAAEDEDEDALVTALTTLETENDERNAIAEDIGATSCVDDVDEPTTTTDPGVTVPPITEPPATQPPATQPPATQPPATQPPATQPPIEMTMPPVTEPPVSGTSIQTFDFGQLITPAGYEWTNIDPTQLADIQANFDAQYMGQIAAIGGASVSDQINGFTFNTFVFFWNEADIVSSGTGINFLNQFTESAVSSSDTFTTEGFPVTIWTDDDGAEGVGVIDADVSVVMYGPSGSTQLMLDFFDAFILAQG